MGGFMDTKEFFSDKVWEQPLSDEITVDRSDYGIKTAGSYLYEYIGGNLYYTFDKLICDEDREGFIQVMNESNEGKSFLVRLIRTDYEKEWFLLKIQSVLPDRIVLTATNVNSVLTSNVRIKENNGWLKNILDMCDYLYFFYERDSDRFYITRITKEGIFNIYEGTLSKWIEEGFENKLFIKGQKKIIDDFRESLENKEYGFEYGFSTGYFSSNKQPQNFSFKGTISVINGVEMTTGIIAPEDGEHIELEGFEISKTRDPLTGVFNKKDIEILARQSMKYHPDDEVLLAIIDIDDFKQVNDTRGHLFGDEVLKRAAEVMKNAVGDKGYVGRIGGDEFMVVINGANSEDEQRNILRSIKNGINSLYSIDSDDFMQTTSIGCARAPLNTSDYKELFKLADYALYLAKEKGKNRYIIYMKEKHGVPEFGDDDNLVIIKPRTTLPMGTFMFNLYDEVLRENTSLEVLLIKTREYLGVDRIILYNSQRKPVEIISSPECSCYDTDIESADYLLFDEVKALSTDKDILKFNNNQALEPRIREAYDMVVKQHLGALLQFKIYDKNEEDFWYFSYEYVEKHTWSYQNIYDYRLISKILSGKL